MSSRPPHGTGAAVPGATLRSPVVAELDRSRRMRWVAVGAALAVGVVLVWVLAGTPPLGADPLTVVAIVLGVVTALYGVEVALAARRADRLARLASSEDQQRRALAADLEHHEAIDVEARRLAAATTLPEAIESILAGARALVPAVTGAVLLAAADDLRVSMTGAHASDDAAAVSAAGHRLAARALARGVTLRGGHETALEEEGAPSRLAVPLRTGAEVVGVLVLERATDNEAFSLAEQRLLERLAPHAAAALGRTDRRDDRTLVHPPAESPTPSPAQDGRGTSVDLSEVVRETVAGLDAGVRADRRIALLARSPAPTPADRGLLHRTLEHLLRSIDLSIPPEGDVAIEVLPVGSDWEVVIAHAGQMLPPQLLEEPPSSPPADPSIQELAAAIGGAVTLRHRSGMAQVRFRVPGVGDLSVGPTPERREAWAVS
ncbi:MAG: GAF domain-containing protein [Nitriliruptoraceae bacterium]